MEVTNTMGAAALVRKYLESDAGSELLAETVEMAAELLMDADVDVLCNAGFGERTEDRVNSRNGHRGRRWDTRAGTINLEVPKLRKGSYRPSLLEPRRRPEQALVSVICQASVEGVSTRWVDDLVRSMGIDGMSKSQVSELVKSLDNKVAEFRNRPLDAGPYTYVWLDALFHKVREGGRVVSMATVIATGVNADGHREVLGVDVLTTEDGAGWMAFLRGLVPRGLSGVALVISDAHEGLKNAIASVLPGACWQRCRTHAMRNLLTRVPNAAQAMVATLVRTVFAQSDPDQVRAQFARVLGQLEAQFPAAAAALLTKAEGVESVTMERVAHEVGINKAMVYRYWNNREDLLTSVLEDEMEHLALRADEAASKEEGFAGKVRASLEVMFEIVGERGVALAILRHHGRTGELEAHRRAIYDGIEIAWAQLVHDAYGVPLARARVATAIFVAGLDAVFRLWLDGVESSVLVEIFAELCADSASGQALRTGPTTDAPKRRSST